MDVIWVFIEGWPPFKGWIVMKDALEKGGAKGNVMRILKHSYKLRLKSKIKCGICFSQKILKTT